MEPGSSAHAAHQRRVGWRRTSCVATGPAHERAAGRPLRPRDRVDHRHPSPELVYANPGFLRPCYRVLPPQQQWIHLYAADLVRARRAIPGARRPHAGPQRRGLLPREPHRPHARPADGLRAVQRAAPGPVLHLAAPDAGGPGAGQSREPARRPAHARALQRDLFRARLPGAISRLRPGPGEGPDRPRLQGLSQDAQRPAARGRHPAPRGRRLLRPAGAVPALVSGRRRAASGSPRKDRRGGQRTRQRRGSGNRPAPVPAGLVPATARRGAEAPFSPDLVVRRASVAHVCPGEPGQAGHQAGLADARLRPGFRRRAFPDRAGRAGRQDPRQTRAVRRAGEGRFLRRAGIPERRSPVAPVRGPRLSGRDGERLYRDARRAHAGDRLAPVADRFAAERGWQQGHLDPWRWPGQRGEPAPVGDRAGHVEPGRQRPAQPRWPTTSSGLAGTSSAPNCWPGFRGSSSIACPT